MTASFRYTVNWVVLGPAFALWAIWVFWPWLRKPLANGWWSFTGWLYWHMPERGPGTRLLQRWNNRKWNRAVASAAPGPWLTAVHWDERKLWHFKSRYQVYYEQGLDMGDLLDAVDWDLPER